jgi:hypothetical protein
MDPRRRLAAWAALSVGGVLLTFAPAVVGLRTLSQRDTDLLYAPVRTLVVEELRAGRLPLWNPYEGTGIPLFAQGIDSVLHPVSLIGAAVAPASIDFLILAYLAAAALGAFALARALGASAPACAGAGVAFALSGFSASMTGNLVFLAGLSTLPWLLAASRSAGAGARWGAVAVAPAAAAAFLSGDVQLALVGLALGAALAGDAGGRRGAARAAGGMAAGILLAAVQILPSRELLPLTYRSLELPETERTLWALAPGRLLEWVVPGLFRGPLAEIPRSSSGTNLAPVFAESVYLGAPLLVAAALGLRRASRTGAVLAGAGALLLWLAMGHHLGARPLLDWVPIWSRFRYSEKLMAPLTLCACALGALGVDAFAAGPLSRAWRRALAAAAAAGGLALLALVLAPAAADSLATRLLGDPGTFYRTTLASGLPHLMAGLAALLALDRLREGRARAAALALLLAVAAASAARYGAHLGSRDLRAFTTPLRLETDSPAPRLAHPEERTFEKPDPAGLVDVIAKVESILLAPAVNVAHRIDTIEVYGAFDALRLTSLVRSFGGEWAHAFRRFGVTHVVVQLPRASAYSPETEGARLVQRDERLGFEVWAVPHRPWAFFARRAVAAEGAGAARDALLDLAARGDDDAVVVEAPEAPTTAPGRVLRVERGTRTLRVEAASDAPALLVVQDAWWPGWRAAVDGEPVEILAADFLVRAVRWPSGRHRLEMTYDPPELAAGLALSALGALLLLLLAARAARRGPAAPVR